MNYTPLIETALTTSTEVTIGNAVPLGGVVRKRGCSLIANGSIINIQDGGMYEVTVNAVFTAAAIGDVTIQLNQDGVNVPGSLATETISVADTQINSIAFTRIVRVPRCGNSNVSVIANGTTAPTISNMVVTVKKV